MRTNAIALLIVVVSALFSACNRPSGSDEVQRLREEVERLKSAQRSAPPVATPVSESPDYQNFLRSARRLMAAIESGVSFQDFHERVADILASAKEASRSAPTPAKQKAIVTFATAVIDAHDIWGYKVANNASHLRYPKGKSTLLVRDVNEIAMHPCGRWDLELPALIAAYKLDTYEDGYTTAYFDRGSSATVAIDLALKKIFKVCANTFEILEAPQ
jgi:hypothetical protein